jgi:hypothetical protein
MHSPCHPAGKDTGGYEFESSALLEHLSIHVALIRELGGHHIRVLLTDWTRGGRGDAVLRLIEHAFLDSDDAHVVRDPARQAGRGYYEGICFKIRASFQFDELEVSEGGFTAWTRRLLSDRKERLCISASGGDRLVPS